MGKITTLNIDSRIKPLYANLLRLDIEEYLISSQFNHLCIENDLDGIWEDCLKYVRSSRSVSVLVPGYTGDARDALGFFLEVIYKKDKDKFIHILVKILKDFEEWSSESKDLNRVKESILRLGYNEETVNQVFQEVEESVSHASVEVPEFRFEEDEEIDESLCFVLMPFAEKFNAIYSDLIKEVVESFELSCVRADEIFDTRPIIEDIWSHIKKSRVLIADLTARNSNVFYELGVAHAMNKKVILITQNLKDVPFDLQHYRCIVYEDSVSGAHLFKDGLRRTLEKVLEDYS